VGYCGLTSRVGFWVDGITTGNCFLFFVFSKKQEIVFKKKKFLFQPPQEVCTQLILITFSTIGYFYKAHKK